MGMRRYWRCGQQLRSPAGHSPGGAVSAEQVGKANDGPPYISPVRDCSDVGVVDWQAAKGNRCNGCSRRIRCLMVRRRVCRRGVGVGSDRGRDFA